MTASKWEISEDRNGNYVFTWGDFQVSREGERKTISASYLNPRDIVTGTTWTWVARYQGEVIKGGDEGDDAAALKQYCEDFAKKLHP